ncbi:MAG: CRISPR-associated helicase Cas3' [Planctomycetaceae bacterium]|nr:CRISPR-associated helicase Cas3' [Planctomycetaceae bacterium]
MPRLKSTQPAKVIPVLSHDECLAKTARDGAETVAGCTVEAHSAAAFEIARELLDGYFSHFRTDSLWEKRDLLAPLLHDVGKVSPLFQEKIHRAFDLDFQEIVPGSFAHGSWKKENHCIPSLLTLEKLALCRLAKIAGSHHGKECSPGTMSAEHEDLGGESWEKHREDFVRDLIRKYAEPHGITLEDISSEESKQPLVLGLTILADWLSSGMELANGEVPEKERFAQVVQEAGFVPFACREGLGFGELFAAEGVPEFEPNAIQRAMTDPENIKPGGVYVLEMEMGAGKTEAALALAYELLAKHRHSGIYFALPTQLTSNKIHERVEPFLRNILEEDTRRKALLVHGKSWLEDRSLKNSFQNDGERGFQSAGPEADSWFSGRKRALLAPFAVGTIDQLLMAVINVRHNALRALGAAGKVVILDEIHSYDAYTGTLILHLVKRLRQWGCSVILLSATLTQKLRNGLLGLETLENTLEEAAGVPYPLLSICDEEGVFYPELDRSGMRSKNVRIVHSSSLEASLNSALECAERGECVLWIENTVSSAQEVFRRISCTLPPGVEAGLIHSRFQEFARREKEDLWVEKYGKSGQKRGGGKILVGTQVLEQSVDIDADRLFTRLCPTDMLLQRIGRLWRHEKLDPLRPRSAECVVEILNEEPFQNKETSSKYEKTPPVYAPYVLMRTQEVFEGRTHLTIPGDMRELIEATYSERKETGWYAELKSQLDDEVRELKRFADLSRSKAKDTQNDTEAATRYSEEETVEVLLLKDWKEGSLLPFGSENWITIPPKTASREERTQCAQELNRFLVRVRVSAAPAYSGFRLEELKHVLYVGTDDSDRPLRAAFVGDDFKLRDRAKNPAKPDSSKPGSRENTICAMSYVEKFGYSYERKDRE